MDTFPFIKRFKQCEDFRSHGSSISACITLRQFVQSATLRLPSSQFLSYRGIVHIRQELNGQLVLHLISWMMYAVSVCSGVVHVFNLVVACSLQKQKHTNQLFFITPTVGKVCDRDNRILRNSNAIFSGSGSENYNRARFYDYGTGWCASGFMPYLMLDLRKEYRITRVVTMGNRDQTKWSESYSMQYSHDKTLVDRSSAVQVFVMILRLGKTI